MLFVRNRREIPYFASETCSAAQNRPDYRENTSEMPRRTRDRRLSERFASEACLAGSHVFSQFRNAGCSGKNSQILLFYRHHTGLQKVLQRACWPAKSRRGIPCFASGYCPAGPCRTRHCERKGGRRWRGWRLRHLLEFGGESPSRAMGRMSEAKCGRVSRTKSQRCIPAQQGR